MLPDLLAWHADFLPRCQFLMSSCQNPTETPAQSVLCTIFFLNQRQNYFSYFAGTIHCTSIKKWKPTTYIHIKPEYESIDENISCKYCPTPCSFCESFCYFHVLDNGLVLCLQCRQQSLLFAIIFQTTHQFIQMSFAAEVQSLITAFPNQKRRVYKKLTSI